MLKWKIHWTTVGVFTSLFPTSTFNWSTVCGIKIADIILLLSGTDGHVAKPQTGPADNSVVIKGLLLDELHSVSLLQEARLSSACKRLRRPGGTLAGGGTDPVGSRSRWTRSCRNSWLPKKNPTLTWPALIRLSSSVHLLKRTTVDCSVFSHETKNPRTHKHTHRSLCVIHVCVRGRGTHGRRLLLSDIYSSSSVWIIFTV